MQQQLRSTTWLRSAGYLTALPALGLEAIVFAGLTFTSGKNIGLGMRVFLLFACLFDLPAYGLSLVRLKLGGLWILANTFITFVMFLGAQVWWASHPEPGVHFDSDTLTGLLEVLTQVLVFCGVRAASGTALFFAASLQPAGTSESSAAARTAFAIAGAYCLAWLIYLLGTWWYLDRHF